jgi:hypothetical protein
VGSVGDGGFLEFVVQALSLGDLKGIAETLVIGAKTEQPAHQRLVGAMTFARPRKGSVEL